MGRNIYLKSVLTLSVPLLVLCIVTTTALYAGQDVVAPVSAPVKELQSATIVWTKEQEKGVELFYRTFIDGRWQKSMQLTDTGTLNHLATVAMDDSDQTWVVWSGFKKHDFGLYYAVLKNGIMIVPPEQIKTGISSNVGPDLAYDRKKRRMVLVWAGSNGEADDIFLSVYDQGKWSSPERVHPKNSVADYLPQINIDQKGVVTVEWSATLTEGPLLFSRKLGSALVKQQAAGLNAQLRKKIREKNVRSCFGRLPADMLGVKDNAVAFRCKGSEQVVRLKNFGSYPTDGIE